MTTRTAHSLLSAICNDRRNSDLWANDKEVTALIDGLLDEITELQRHLNTPELHDFATGVISEGQHQRARWGSEHDSGKQPEDWF